MPPPLATFLPFNECYTYECSSLLYSFALTFLAIPTRSAPLFDPLPLALPPTRTATPSNGGGSPTAVPFEPSVDTAGGDGADSGQTGPRMINLQFRQLVPISIFDEAHHVKVECIFVVRMPSI